MTKQYFKFRWLLSWILVLEILLIGIAATVIYVIFPEINGAKWANFEWRYLYFLGPIFALLYLFLFRWKKKAIDLFGEERLLRSYMAPMSNVKILQKYLLIRLVIFLAFFAILRPQLGSKQVEAKTEGIDIMFCLDISKSMLAEDIQPNRLAKAKRLINRTIDDLHGDRIGIVVFAGEAFVQLPITSDYRAARLFLNTVETDFISTQGTAIGQAIELANQSFDLESPAKKAIIVITDGENHEDDAIATAEMITDNDVKVYAVGMGTERGAPLPVGNSKTNFKRDKDGNIVVSKLNVEMVNEIADAGNGKAYIGSDVNGIVSDLTGDLGKIEKSELGTKVYSEYEDRFQFLLLPCVLFLFLELFISERRNKSWIKE